MGGHSKYEAGQKLHQGDIETVCSHWTDAEGTE